MQTNFLHIQSQKIFAKLIRRARKLARRTQNASKVTQNTRLTTAKSVCRNPAEIYDIKVCYSAQRPAILAVLTRDLHDNAKQQQQQQQQQPQSQLTARHHESGENTVCDGGSYINRASIDFVISHSP